MVRNDGVLTATLDAPHDADAKTRMILDARLKLRRDVIFLPAADGVMFYHETGYFSLKGKSLHPFVSKLLPLLDGSRRVGEICSQLDAARAAQVIKLIESLHARGIFRDFTPEADDLLPESVKRHFQRHIDFIGHYTKDPQARFRKFRNSRILIAGDGEPLASLGASLLRNGLRQVRFACPPDAIDQASLEAEIAELQTAGVDSDFGFDPTELARLDGFDLVVYASSRPSVRAVLELNEACRAAGTAFLPAIALHGHNYLGPLSAPGGSACWRCAYLRLVAGESPERAAELRRSAESGEKIDNPAFAGYLPAAQMLGNNAAFEIFKHRCGHLLPETADGVIWQSLLTLESQQVRLLPHPACPHDRDDENASEIDLAAIVADDSTSEEEQGALVNQWKPFVHSSLGIIQTLNGDETAQIPLRSAVATFGQPRANGERQTVYGFDAGTTAGALRAALIEATRRYSRDCARPGSLRRGTFEELRQQGADPVWPEDLLLSTKTRITGAETRDWAPAYSLLTRTVRFVPAEALYPQATADKDGLGGLPAAVTTGRNFGEIAKPGILRALAYDRIASFPLDGEVIEWNPGQLKTLGPDVQFLLDSLDRLGEAVRVVELPGPDCVHVAIVFLGRTPSLEECVIGFGAFLREAAAMALLSSVGATQTGNYAQSAVERLADLRPELLPALSNTRAGVLDPDGAPDGEPAPECAADEAVPLPASLEVLFADITSADLRSTRSLLSGVFLLTRRESRRSA